MKKIFLAFFAFTIILSSGNRNANAKKADTSDIVEVSEKVYKVKNAKDEVLKVKIKDEEKELMRIKDDLYIEAEVSTVVENSVVDETVLNGLLPETRADLLASLDGSNESTILVYTPVSLEDNETTDGISTRGLVSTYKTTYVGYNNYTYYQETLYYKNTKSMKDVKSGTSVVEKVDQWNEVILWQLIGGVMDSISFGGFSLASAVPQAPSYSPNSGHVWQASMMENKWKKYTYVVQNGQYYFGSRTEYATNYFYNELNLYHTTLCTGNSVKKAHTSANYNRADIQAYFYYGQGGWTEEIDKYKLGNAYFYSQ